MESDETDVQIDTHFTELGDIVLDSEDGHDIKITTFVCNSCGSLILIKRAHWATHNTLPTAWVDPT